MAEVDVIPAAGAFELGLLAREAAQSGRYVAVAALGCVIRGGTPHFEYVCSEAARAMTLAALDTGIPVGFGLITCDTPEQAWERAGGATATRAPRRWPPRSLRGRSRRCAQAPEASRRVCADVLIDADTIRSPDMRHVIPAGVIDPFLFGEHDGVAFVLVSPLDAPTIAAACPDLRMIDMIADLGLMELIASGGDPFEAMLEVRLRVCRELGVTALRCPRTSRWNRPSTCARAGWTWSGPAALRRPAAGEERRRAGGHPPRHPCCRGRPDCRPRRVS